MRDAFLYGVKHKQLNYTEKSIWSDGIFITEEILCPPRFITGSHLFELCQYLSHSSKSR